MWKGCFHTEWERNKEPQFSSQSVYHSCNQLSAHQDPLNIVCLREKKKGKWERERS